MYALLDVLLLVFHSVLIVFNLFGWIWRSTRRWHMIVLGLTCFSWFGFGLFYGFGYCPCTDWHWDVKRELGETGLPRSYVKYYADAVTGLDWSAALVDRLVSFLGLGALAISVYLNLRDRRRAREPGVS